MRSFSYGGGVQSTAALCLAAAGKLQYDAFVFANVGNDSENPATLDYIERYAKPFAAAHGLKFVEVQKTNRAGELQTLRGRIMTTPRSVPLPSWLPSGAFGNRTCTNEFKIQVIAKWLKQNGATKDNPATLGIGISTDEWTRARSDSGIAWEVLEYPLLDLRLSRNNCRAIIVDAGLPIPPKSSCYFCPFHTRREWERILREMPDLFAAAVEIDYHIREKRGELGKDGMYLHQAGIPLDKAVGLQYEFDFREDDLPCDTGYCFL